MARSGTGTIRIGLVGLGRAGWGMHRGELSKRPRKFKIVAGCDQDAARRKMLADAEGCRTYASIDELVRDPTVELVDIASRSRDHVAHALAALKAGKQVFLEKPMAISYAGAMRLRRAAAASEGTLYVRYNRRFEAAFVHIREIMASRILGEVHQIKLRRNSWQRRDDWQTLMAHGGGQLLNWGPHVIDHALQLLEAPVARQWSDLKRIAAAGDAEDHLKIVLKGENGRIIDLEISGGMALKEPEWTVYGTRGALMVRGEEMTLRYLKPRTKLAPCRAKTTNPALTGGFADHEKLSWIERTIPVKPRKPTAPDSIWDHLYDTIRKGKPFPITLDDAVAVMRVISEVRRGTPFEIHSLGAI